MTKESDKESREKKIRFLRRICKQHGIKVTPQRMEVFLEIIEAADHPSAEQVFERVRTRLPTISLDTVYRTLSTFDRLGLISKVYFVDDRTRFDPNTTHHHHLVCTICKNVMDFQWPELDNAHLPSESEGWGEPSTKLLQIMGTCSKCLSKSVKKQNKETDLPGKTSHSHVLES
jgi:Fur family peroxide stress response transcriptional regulator